MRRLLLILAVLAGAVPASAQNCVTINGVSQCAAPWQVYDATVRVLSLPVIDLSQTWSAGGTTFTGLRLNITDTASASGSLLADFRVGGVSRFSVAKGGAIGTTSTDGVTLANPFASTSSLTVQMSPRIKLSGTAWNSTSGASETDSFFLETLPATVAGTTTATWKLGSIINGGAATYPLTVSSGGTVTSLFEFQATSGGRFSFSNGGLTSVFEPVASGINRFRDGSGTWGVEWKFDATPTVSACGAGSPAVTAGSTPLVGSVTIGTTSVATCTITFNGTAFPSAPHCSGSVETTTAANARAMGYSASTTVLTIVPASAWADSSVVNWICLSAK